MAGMLAINIANTPDLGCVITKKQAKKNLPVECVKMYLQ